MDTSRREFVERLTGGVLVASSLPFVIDTPIAVLTAAAHPVAAEEWDLSWTSRVTGNHKAIFDVPAIESGYGVWRAGIVKKQYVSVLKAAPKDVAVVLVLRHDAIHLAMQQSYWDAFGIGKAKGVKHPATEQPTEKNPALLTAANGGLPAQFDGLALDQFMANGGIVLGCALAFGEVVGAYQKRDNSDEAAAHRKALDALVPGVIMQPSGVFAAMRAQQVGCVYVRAS